MSLGTKMLLIAVCILLSLVAAIVASWVKHSPGASPRDTVASGGGAFATTMLVCMAVLGTFMLL